MSKLTTTYKNNWFDIDNVEALKVDVEEIAHALSLKCRYNGHSNRFYSVAEHSVHVSDNCPTCPLVALFHDAAEAYLPDIPHPLKSSPLLKPLLDKEEEVRLHIFRSLGLPLNIPQQVMEVDRRIIVDEGTSLFGWEIRETWKNTLNLEPLNVTIHGWSPPMAREHFLRRAWNLVKLG